VEASAYPYPRWLGVAAPALATLGIELAIQPALERIERSELPSFFLQVVFGASATALLVVGLVKLGVPIQGDLVLTGSLLRFLPGGTLVRGCTT
jgi:uncharacterized membrane protein YjjP (DUF1212 family)